MREKITLNEGVWRWPNFVLGQGNPALKLRYLAHYTTIDIARIILTNRQIKANCITNLNDQYEYHYLCEEASKAGYHPDFRHFYVSCFTMSQEESIPQWFMYTNDSKGVLIRYHLSTDIDEHVRGFIDYGQPIYAAYTQKCCIKKEDRRIIEEHTGSDSYWYWHESGKRITVNLTAKLVCYDQKEMENEPGSIVRENIPSVVLDNACYYKEHGWAFEDEARIICSVLPLEDNTEIDKPEYFLLPVKMNNIPSIEIISSPWATDVEKRLLRDLCDEHSTPECLIYPTQSVYEGKLVRK